jgi:tetratricopeptide (TPR) repeat protein
MRRSNLWCLFLVLLLASCAGLSLQKEAQDLADQKQWGMAVLFYEEAVERDPENRALRLKLIMARDMASFQYYEKGKTLFEEGLFDLALEELQKAVSLNPSYGLASQLIERIHSLEQRSITFFSSGSAQGREKLVDTSSNNSILNKYSVVHSPQSDISSTPSILGFSQRFFNVSVGQEFPVQIVAEHVFDLFSSSFYLVYDRDLFEVVRPQEGNFLKQDGQPTIFLSDVHADKGLVILGSSRMGKTEGISGSGDLANIIFRARAAGTGSFSFQSVNLIDGKRAPLEVKSESLTVRSD